jgi:hypothetical protein
MESQKAVWGPGRGSSLDPIVYRLTVTEVHHTADPAWFDATVTHESEGAGRVALTAQGDIDKPANGTFEDVTLHSRWNAEGAGRADVQMSGGSLPTTVQATECWSETFARSYYTDNVNYQPTEGSPTACAFSSTQP